MVSCSKSKEGYQYVNLLPLAKVVYTTLTLTFRVVGVCEIYIYRERELFIQIV